MALHAILATLEEIPEALRAEYQEIPDPTDKTKTLWALDLDDSVRTHPKVRALSSTLDRLKASLSEKTTALATATERLAVLPEGFDPDAYRALIEESAGKGKKIDERIAAVRAEEAKKLEAALAPVSARVKLLEGAMKRKAASEVLGEALASSQVAPEFMAAASALLQTKYAIKTEELTPGEFSVSVETEAGDTDAKEFVRTWATSDEGKVFVAKAKGGGADGGQPARGGGENPFDGRGGKTPNLTKQQILIKTNPAQARSLALAAGVRPTW